MDKQNICQPLISLCIPTNGVIQWVFPVLDSIYAQNVDSDLYEVVVMDNGYNSEFKKKIREYAKNHDNLVYCETNAYEFMSEIETYRAASGYFIKFINHRTKLREGTLQAYIDFVNKYKDTDEKPFIYYSCGVLKLKPEIVHVDTFDAFVKKLSYWSSWSTGMAFWKSDFDAIPNVENANYLFPHTKILFSQRNRHDYIIDDRDLLDEIPVGGIPKGRYNLFDAFAVEYPALLLELERSGDISKETFLYVKKQNFNFVASLYFVYILLKRPCSYDLSDFKNSLNCYYSMGKVHCAMIPMFMQGFGRKIKRLVGRN